MNIRRHLIQLKKLVSRETLLFYPDVNKPFKIHADSSTLRQTDYVLLSKTQSCTDQVHYHSMRLAFYDGNPENNSEKYY